MSQNIPLLAEAIEAVFKAGDWKALGHRFEISDYINSHSRLLRSLSWRDDDYSEHIYSALEYLFSSNEDDREECFAKLISTPKIKEWIQSNRPTEYLEYFGTGNVDAFQPAEPTEYEKVVAAIQEAKALNLGAGKGIDRLHTALHAYLKEILKKHNVEAKPNDSITALFKLALNNVPALQIENQRSDEIKKSLRSIASIIDALNPIRNHATLVHANNELIGDSEAIFMSNLVHSILTYIDAKITEFES